VLPNEVSEANAHNYFVGGDGVLVHNGSRGSRLVADSYIVSKHGNVLLPNTRYRSFLS